MEITDLPKTVPGLDACTAYIAAKGVHFPHKEGRDCTEQYLGRVHIDISGPMQVKSASGKEYEYIAVDDYSRAMYTRPLRHKFDTPEVFKIFMAAAEKESSKEIMTDTAHNQTVSPNEQSGYSPTQCTPCCTTLVSARPCGQKLPTPSLSSYCARTLLR